MRYPVSGLRTGKEGAGATAELQGGIQPVKRGRVALDADDGHRTADDVVRLLDLERGEHGELEG